tara:strand:+ start:1273 stop:1809 length:537 start_codon:yes stop_codon:yes gene_type:complete
MIQNRLNKLKPYFKGLKIAENYRIVEVNLKNSWLIEENSHIEVQQKPIKESSNVLYNMFYSDTKSFDEILDFIEEKVIKPSLEIEEKERLLRVKVEELKRVFENKNLDELNNLKFTTEDNSLKLGTSKRPPQLEQVSKEVKDPRPSLKPAYLNDMDNKNKTQQNGTTKELSREGQPSK